MQITGIGVEYGHLTLPGRNHMGVAMSHMGNVVDTVKISLTILIDEVLPPAPHYFQGLIVGNAEIFSDMFLSISQNVCAAPTP